MHGIAVKTVKRKSFSLNDPIYLYTENFNVISPLHIMTVGQIDTLKRLALRVTTRLALRGYSVASLPRRFALAFSVASLPRNLKKKKSVSQSTQNGLKCIKMPKNFFTPLTHFKRAASGKAQPYLPVRSLRSLGLRASRSLPTL